MNRVILHVFVIVCILISVFVQRSFGNASVRYIQPSYGGMGGEVRLTIHGSGFSKDQFSQSDDPAVGNRVYFVGKTGDEVSCKIHRDGCTQNLITCYTPLGMRHQVYYVKVIVDNVTIPDSNLCGSPLSPLCAYNPLPRYTPTIDSFTPNSGTPGDFVRFDGQLFSDRYGSNVDTATNGKEQKITRVYVGPQNCGLKNGDDFWGLNLTSEDTDLGHIICKTKGTSIGYFNASFIVESPFGRSIPDFNKFLVSYKDDIYMYQVYTNITSISPSTGSVVGGLTLTVYGKYFDDRLPYTPAKAYIEDSPCKVTKVKIDEYLECTVTKDPEYSKQYYRGNRGAVFEFWEGVTKDRNNMDEILTLPNTDETYNSKLIDNSYYNDTKTYYVSRMTFFFLPPKTGEYAFHLYGDDAAKMFIDGVVEAFSSQEWAYSRRMTLNKDTRYRIQIIHFQIKGNSIIHLKAKSFVTSLTSSMVGKAHKERQLIRVTTRKVYELQHLTFSGFAEQKAISEVQNVVIKTYGLFRLGIFGVFTKPLSFGSDITEIASAFNSLPVWNKDESVKITRAALATPTFTFTFDSKRGDFPDVQVRPVGNDDPPEVIITETTKGVPDGITISLMLGGSVSIPFNVKQLSVSKLTEVVDSLFTARCPSVFESSFVRKVYVEYETRGEFHGTMDKNSEPFCGRFSVINPVFIFVSKNQNGIRLSLYRMVCFAYKGVLKNMIVFGMTFKNSYGHRRYLSRSVRHEFKKDYKTKSSTWYYTCHDMALSIGTTAVEITRIQVLRATQGDIHIDSLFIGKRATISDDEISLLRLRPAMPDGHSMNAIYIRKLNDYYIIVMRPFDCGSGFDLFRLANGEIQSGSTDISSDQVIFKLSNGKSESLKIDRIDIASPPVSGLVDMVIKGNIRKDLDLSQSAASIQTQLESVPGIGSLDVDKKGDCANFVVYVNFLTLAGDVPLMTVTNNRLRGLEVAIAVEALVDGGLFYDPLTGDMMSTVHNKPQVRVMINDVPTACTGDCTFKWSSTKTPSVYTVAPSSGTSALSTRLTIKGAGFSSNPSSNTVTIGGVPCTVTSATLNSITCSVGNGPVGSHKVIVTVHEKGDANHGASNKMFTYIADITGLSPRDGSLGGGQLLTLTGHGFKSGAVVTINDKPCGVVSVEPGQLICVVPHSTVDGSFPVKVKQGSVVLSRSSYTYDISLTATVTSITPSSIPVTGGFITIDGNSFGNTPSTVKLGTKQVTISSWSHRQIDIETGPLSEGKKLLKIDTGNGFALTRRKDIPEIDVVLSVTNVYPLRGSLLGGTVLTITGNGFGTDSSQLEVKVGNTMCDVSASTNTKITCQIGNAGRIHDVTNKGVHKAFGIYYAFDRPYITIHKGDFVRWTWTTPTFVPDVVHAIMQVEKAGSYIGVDGGFDSGTPTRNGQFIHQFNEVGEYFVWSGFNDLWNIKNYAGTVKVVEARSHLAPVIVKLAGMEARSQVGFAPNPTSGHVCNEKMSGCTDSFPGGATNMFNFAFWSCSTPIITGIHPRNGTTQTTITITGIGLSTSCKDDITIGSAVCAVTTSTDTLVNCHISKSGTPAIGLLQLLSFRVGNRGTALLKIMSLEERSFALIPNIDSVSPLSGSVEGGALITLSGFGLMDSPYVTLNKYQCRIVSKSYTEIVCETPTSSKQQVVDVEVTVLIGGQPYPVKCETPSYVCKYAYLMDKTASIRSISPRSTSGFLSFTIKGFRFGTSVEDIQVKIGGEVATVIAVSDSTITGTIENLPVGKNDVEVYVKNYGKASRIVYVDSNAAVTAVRPSKGSVYGETTITIMGNGFIANETTVSIGDSVCTVQSVNLSHVICTTSNHSEADVGVEITSKSEKFPLATYSFDSDSTPKVMSINPAAGSFGTSLTINGERLDGTEIKVTLGDSPCTVKSSSPSQINCVVGSHETGSVPVMVYVLEMGASNSDVEFEYELVLSGINPNTGSIGGGQTITLTGSGFESSANVTICDKSCDFVNHTASELICKTPPHEGIIVTNANDVCDVILTLNNLVKTLTGAYTYDGSLTPIVSEVSPQRGGTGGGTPITIKGSGFGTTTDDLSVTIDGTSCAVQSVFDTEINCLTGEHVGSIEAKVHVEVGGNGIAVESTTGDANFWYIDVWSSEYTWGGGPLPEAGEFVVIQRGHHLLLDIDTPVFKFLLIQGGKLIFDNKDVELNAEIIMITDGGLLQVGTEAEPFQHKGIITLHGHHRIKELPIYGTKVLAVRNGTLDLHGIPVPITWTRLASTATIGSNTLQLQDPVEWKIGDEIVIASTGNLLSQSENEKKVIQSVSSDKMTLTLSTALEAKHVGTEETFAGTLVEFRAEVGLLTHNVVVRGNSDSQWEKNIKPCEAGFDTGEFVVQTCFLGRFGDDMGSSQFGGMIFVHGEVRDTQEARARLSYIEVTFAGQAFRLGRYPIHFHLNGEMSESYVRGVGIHHTFNRAVNIHGSHNTLVEKTVLYDVMGGAFFLEDGIETGNIFQYNLAVFVRESSSLLNDDITPASFWITNPNNIIRHNAAAGGTHFGYWYRMHHRPDGPSFTNFVCPQEIPLGEFYNNSAHSFGWFGFWVFPTYIPKENDCRGGNHQPAVFRKIFSWNNEKGAETVNTAALQFIDCTFVQNRLAGYEGKQVKLSRFNPGSAMLKDSLVVGTTTVIPDEVQGCSNGAVVLGYGNGFQVINTRFVNFPNPCSVFTWATIVGLCHKLCGGYTYHTRNLTFVNAPNRVRTRWVWEGVIVDRDGSLTGKSQADWKVVPTTGTLPSDCENAMFPVLGGPVSVCPPNHIFHRFALNNALPEVLTGKDLIYSNKYGTEKAKFRPKAVTYKTGWKMGLLNGEPFTIDFENVGDLVNISWRGGFSEFTADDYVIMKMKVGGEPDRVSLDRGLNFIDPVVGTLDPSIHRLGDWNYNVAKKELSMMIHGTERSKRDVSTRLKRDARFEGYEQKIDFLMYKCFFPKCVKPKDADQLGPQKRPANFYFWDNPAMWEKSDDGFVTNMPLKGGKYGIPRASDNVRIVKDTWVIVAVPNLKTLNILLLEGVLEFMDSPGKVFELNANIILIRGGRLVIGTPEAPFQASASIILRGTASSPSFTDGEDSSEISPKSIAVFGGLDLHGKDKGLTWTKLALTAVRGGRRIVLADTVGWEMGDEIVVGPTSYNVWETESFKITKVEADKKTLTLNDTLRYQHIAHTETINGRVIQLGAAVGLLTHNIKVIGNNYPDLYKESFGGRVFVGLTTHNERTFTGYARVSNVEFYHMGQESYTMITDPRFGLAYVDTGTVSAIKPSYVSQCSFHNGFNSAIGAFGTSGMNITDNVVFGSVGHAIRTNSEDTRLEHNMVAYVMWTGSYLGRREPYNIENEAGIEAMGAERLILKNNLVSGSERIGFHVPPLSCDDSSNDYDGNVAQANVIGIAILTKDNFPYFNCVKFNNFMTWKNLDYGFYYQHYSSFVSDNNTVIEDGNGYHLYILGPDAKTHIGSNKMVEIKNGLVVGTTSSFTCDPVKQTINLRLRQCKSGRAPNGGRVGITFPNFMSMENKAPITPWTGIMSPPAINGLMKLNDLTFAHFIPSQCNGSYAITTNFASDDGQHPILTGNITFFDVDETNKISYHRPNLELINGADCVDMDCDGQKKCMLKDLDGSFIGAPGAVIPQSEYEWDANLVRGIGDYRIPKEMITSPDGTKMSIDILAPRKGIFRGPGCTFIDAWTAYKCTDINYSMMIIESMDEDTERRRLSPVAILSQSNKLEERFVDLINGPQDHGWCTGYACRKRISTFMAIVATGRDYLLHYTAPPPKHTRFRLLNAEEDQGIKLSVYYNSPNGLDVFVDGEYVLATNGRIEDGNYILQMPEGDEFMPKLSDVKGTNFVDRDTGLLTFIIKGPSVIDIVTREAVVVSFGMPAVTTEEFFKNLIENVAAFFDIPLTKVRIVDIKNEQSKRRRRRRETDGSEVTLEISDEPGSTDIPEQVVEETQSPLDETIPDSFLGNDTYGNDTYGNETFAEPPEVPVNDIIVDESSKKNGSLSHNNLVAIASNIVNECQGGQIATILNVAGSCGTVTVPPANVSEPPVTYKTPSPRKLVMHTQPKAHYEGVPLTIQPVVHAVDIEDAFVTPLGTEDFPWQLSVSISPKEEHEMAYVGGSSVANASDGWFNFSDISISIMGTGYTLDFKVIFPDNAANFTVTSGTFDVEAKQVKTAIKVGIKAILEDERVMDQPFIMILNIRDAITNKVINDINWRGHTWMAEAELIGSPKLGGLIGNLSEPFNVATGEAMFSNLVITGPGVYYLRFNVTSTPMEYNLTTTQKVVIKDPRFVGIEIEERNEVKLMFDADYDKVISSPELLIEFETFMVEYIIQMYGENITIESSDISKGSIIVTFVIAGNATEVMATTSSLCDSVINGTTYDFNGQKLTLSPYMTVNNAPYLGVSCGVKPPSGEESGLNAGTIVGIVIGAIVILVLFLYPPDEEEKGVY